MFLAIIRSIAGTSYWSRRCVRLSLALLLVCCCWALAAPIVRASISTPAQSSAQQAPPGPGTRSSLESAAAKAGSTGRAVAMSLIGLAFAVAATVLAFRRDFKEAAGVFAVGIISVLLATPAGVRLLQDTVSSLFGSG
jgi:hypothetical protein